MLCRWTAVVVCWAGLVVGGPASAQLLDPVFNRGERLYEDIYDKAEWAARAPYALAMPVLARAKLKSWVNDRKLSPPVRARVLGRIQSEVFIDEIIPFLLFVKDLHDAAENSGIERFDTMLRHRFAPGDPIPGMQHGMFQWQPVDEPQATNAADATNEELLARIVALYDALYLQGVAADVRLETSLACESRETDAALSRSVSQVKPLVRALVEEVAERLEVEGEMGSAVDGILEDDGKLEAITASGIEFLDQLVCKTYRSFLTQLHREAQLRKWMRAELDQPGGGRLWDYLAASQRRRHAVLTVVDGLQGHLIEALARGKGDAVFLRAVQAELRRGEAMTPPGGGDPPQKVAVVQREFLRALTGRGFHHPHYLRFFRDLYTDEGAKDLRRPVGVSTGGIATTPTISVRNLPIVWTGAPVAGEGATGIPNFHFVDRQYTHKGELRGRPYYFFGNDAVRLPRLTEAAGMRSLFERLPTRTSMSCAAMYDARAHWSLDGLLNLAIGEVDRDFGERHCMSELEIRSRNSAELRGLRTRLLAKRQSLDRNLPWYQWYQRLGRDEEAKLAQHLIDDIAELESRSLPELLVYYNPWPDHFAHFEGPFSDEILAPSGELNRLDYWLERLGTLYREGGVESHTLFGMAGDHGLAPIFQIVSPEQQVFDRLASRGLRFQLAKISSDEGEGPKLNNPLDPPVMKGLDVVVASTAGGNYMLDFFVDQAAGWSRQPLRAELQSLHLVHQPEGPTVDILKVLLDGLRDSLEYLVVRETHFDAQGGVVRIAGWQDGQSAEGWISRRGMRIHYHFVGADLLGLKRKPRYLELSKKDRYQHDALYSRCVKKAKIDQPVTWCDESQWRLLASATDRPDAVVQLAHLYDSERAGSVNLFPREGYGYNTTVPGRHAGESFHEKDAFVGLWGAPLAGLAAETRLGPTVNGSVPMAIYEYLTGASLDQGIDGWGYPAIGEQLFPDALTPP
jgi:hypothetical protein